MWAGREGQDTSRPTLYLPAQQDVDGIVHGCRDAQQDTDRAAPAGDLDGQSSTR